MNKFFALANEVDLVAGLKTHDAAIFTLLYERYAGALLGVLLRIVHDPDDAADLLQESFVKIWQQGHRYDPTQGRLFTWFLTITRRTALDYLRVKKTQATQYAAVAFSSPPANFTPTYHYIGFQSWVDGLLADKHRQIITLAYWGGHTHEEIANELNLPLGTVKTRIRLALKHLREVLAQEENL